MIWLTVPEVRRLLLALSDPPERFEFRLTWSCWRRRHQAVARRCHAARRTRERPASLRTERAPTPERGRAHQELSDEAWARLKRLLPSRKPPDGQPGIDHRQVLNAILWVQRNGGSWRQLPEQFGGWARVYSRFRDWQRTGLWQKIKDAMDDDSTIISS